MILVILKLYIFVDYRDLNVSVGPPLDYGCYWRGVKLVQRLKVSSIYRHCSNVARTETRFSDCEHNRAVTNGSDRVQS